MPTLQEIEDQIASLTLLEAAQLVTGLETRLGVSAQQQQQVAPANLPTTPVVEEKTEFSLILTGFGGNKINVIKTVREVTSLGLKEAKDVVDALPATIKSELSRADAEAFAKKFTDAGATVSIV